MDYKKKGFIPDVAYGLAAVFSLFIVTAIVILIITNFNSGVQTNSDIPTDAKEWSQNNADTVPPTMGYVFMSYLAGLIIYSIISAFLVETLGPIYLIVAVLQGIGVMVFLGIMNLIYGDISTSNLLTPALVYIPGADLVFTHIGIFGTLWIGALLLVLYFK